MVVEASIVSARHEVNAVHHVVEESFESLCEDRVRAWLHAKSKGKKDGCMEKLQGRPRRLVNLFVVVLREHFRRQYAKASGS
jgi:hypothetical protein